MFSSFIISNPKDYLILLQCYLPFSEDTSTHQHTAHLPQAW